MAEGANDYQFWSKRADRYDAATTYIVGVQTEEAAKSWLRNQLTAADVVLEIGCGTGIFSQEIAEKVQHLTATDMSQEMLAKAQARLQACSNVEVQTADAYQTGYSEQKFDVVFIGNVLHIVQDPAAVLREGRRLLKPGGRLLLIDYTARGLPVIAQMAMTMRYLSQYGLPPRSGKNFRLDDLVALAQGAKLEVRDAQTFTCETSVFCVCAVKK